MNPANTARIFELGTKGLSLIQSLAQQGKDIKPVITSLMNVFSKHPEQITDEELDKVESDLDVALDEFERSMKKLG